MSYNFIKHNHVVEEFHMYYCSFKIKRHNITRVISWCNQATRATLYVSSIAEQQSGLVHQLQEHVQPSFDEKCPLVVLSLHERPKGQQNPLWKVSFVEMKPRYIDQIFYCTQLSCVWGVKGANPKKRSRVSWCSREVISWRERLMYLPRRFWMAVARELKSTLHGFDHKIPLSRVLNYCLKW